MNEITTAETRIGLKRDSLDRAEKFVDHYKEIYETMEEDGRNVEDDASFGPSLSFIEISLKARYNSMDDVPIELMEERDWDKSSVSQSTSGRYALYLKDRIDLRG